MYFSQIRVDPNNPDRVITRRRADVPLDRRRQRRSIPRDPTEHDDKHALWWDPSNSNHLLIGTTAARTISYDMTRTWIFYPNIVAGLFYHVGFDYEYPYNVCGGMQDNYDWCGPSAVRTRGGIQRPAGQSIQGGDGFVAIIDARDSHIVYTETQDGNTQRHNKVTGESKSIRPSAQNVVNAGGVAATATQGSGWRVPLQLGYADDVLADRIPACSTSRGNQRVPLDRSRRFVDGHQPGSDDRTRTATRS